MVRDIADYDDQCMLPGVNKKKKDEIGGHVAQT
jgi:hypothetical protein